MLPRPARVFPGTVLTQKCGAAGAGGANRATELFLEALPPVWKVPIARVALEAIVISRLDKLPGLLVLYCRVCLLHINAMFTSAQLRISLLAAGAHQ
jgi:hypothetical protein